MLIDLMAGEKVCGCATLVLRIDGLTAQLWKRGAGGSQGEADPKPTSTSLNSSTLDGLQSRTLLLSKPEKRSTSIQHSKPVIGSSTWL